MRLIKRLNMISLDSAPGSVCRGRYFIGRDPYVTGAVVVVLIPGGTK